jgi:hypothetical protein
MKEIQSQIANEMGAYSFEKLDCNETYFVRAEIEGYIKGLLQEIIDPETVFSQTEDLEKCKYCHLRGFCGRNQA